MPLGIVPEVNPPPHHHHHPTFKALVNAAAFLMVFTAFVVVVFTDLVVGCWPGLSWGLFGR